MPRDQDQTAQILWTEPDITSGTMEEKKRRLSALSCRVEVRQGDELNIQRTPSFEQFLDGLIEMR